MRNRKVRPVIDRSVLYTHVGDVGEESELRSAQLGPENAIFGSGIALDSCILNRVKVTHAPGIRFENGEAETIDCANAVLDESGWRLAHIAESRCIGTRINFSHFDRVTWIDCQMSHVQFQESKLKQVEFDSCDLTGAFFNGAEMPGTVFAGSNLTGADFSRAEIARCDFRRANIEGIKLEPSQLRGVIVTPDQALYLAKLLGLDVRE